MSEFNDFLKAISEAKAKDPTKILLSEVKENIKEDISNLFSELSKISSKDSNIVDHPETIEAIDNIVETVNSVEQIDLLVEEQKQEIRTPEQAAAGVEKYLRALPKDSHSFQQPLEQPVDQNFKTITDKIKFLEQWVGKISAAGPGSGEVWFRWLDDTNRDTMTPSNDNWVLEYDATTKKVQFTENVGPIRTVKFNTAGYQTPLVAGQLGWNVLEDCLDVKQADDTTLQVGLEHYFQIHNTTGTTLLNGEVVMFAGVDAESTINPIPMVSRYTANGSATPLYIVGVMTNDVPNTNHGRATVFGKVRNLNTTGSSVGETWVKGDLLWAHPTLAGKLTKVRPTAPDVATSIAAVLQVGTTDGILLVRPTIWPRLFYGDWYSTQNQSHTTINTAKRITVNNTGFASGFTNNNGLITAENAGLYNFQFSLQLISSNSSAQYLWIWYRKNGVDAPNSATKLSISSNSIVLAPSWNFPVSMHVGDTFELMWAADSINMSLSSQAATEFCPAIPAVILTVTQVNL